MVFVGFSGSLITTFMLLGVAWVFAYLDVLNSKSLDKNEFTVKTLTETYVNSNNNYADTASAYYYHIKKCLDINQNPKYFPDKPFANSNLRVIAYDESILLQESFIANSGRAPPIT